MSLLDNAIAFLKETGEKFQVSSGLRSVADNARVGGVTNSYHMKGQALDLVPTGGQGMGGLYNDIKASLLSAGIKPIELLNEGDHVHVAFQADQSFGASQATTAGAGINSGDPIGDFFAYIKNLDVDGTTPDNVRSQTLTEATGITPDKTGKGTIWDNFASHETLVRAAFIAVALILFAAGIFLVSKGNPQAIIEKVTS